MRLAIRDLRLAARNMLRAPGFSLLVVGILAVGLGSSVTVLSLVKGILLDPLGFEESGELVFLQEARGDATWTIAYPNFRDWRERQGSFEHLGAYTARTMSLTGDGNPARLDVIRASAAVFDALAVPALIGRTFLPDDDRLGAERTVVVSHQLWRQRLAADPEVVGTELNLDDQAYTVIGVMPRGFDFPYFSPGATVDLWVPMELFADEGNMQHRADHPGLFAVARLADGVDIDAARADMDAIAAALEREYPDSNANAGVEIVPLQERVVGPARPTLLILSAAVAFMLAIVVANTGSLLLVRATGRGQELAIRAALGAGRGRLLGHVLAEGLVLGLAGGLAGIGVAALGLRLLERLARYSLPRLAEATIDGGVLAAGGVLAVLVGLLLGAVPGLLVARGDLQADLKGRRSTERAGRSPLRDGLVVAEVVVAVVLLVGAGLTARSLARMLTDDPGVEPEGVLTARVALPSTRYEDPEAIRDFFRRLAVGLDRLPGVDAAGTVWPLPLSGNTWGRWYHVEGEPPADPAEIPVAGFGQVSPGTFDALGVPVLRGRGFTAADDRDAPLVAVVDERFAERWWPGENPLGKRLKLGTHDEDNPWRQVVGVVPNVRFRGVAAGTREQIWVPVEQDTNSYQAIVLRTEGDPAALAPSVERVVASLDPELPVFAVRTLADFHAATADRERTLAVLIGGFALVGQLLATIGLYGVLAFTVARRQREIGVRMALGARARDVVLLVGRRGGRLLAVGLGAGLLLAYGGARWLASELYGVDAADPTTFLAVAALVAAAGIASSSLPSWRAARIDPMESLRRD